MGDIDQNILEQATKRMKRLKLNTISSLLYQIVSVVCAFVLPHAILEAYGSEINGLVNSITNFLGVISFLQLGVGAVVESALYKPLANGDAESISKIMVSARKFFRRIGIALCAYVIALSTLYPYLSHSKFDWLYTTLLIVAISINSFSQYYFGITSSLVLTSSQHGYVRHIAQSITLLLNTLLCVILIKNNAGIHAVKLMSSLLHLLCSLLLNWYVTKRFEINWKTKNDEEPIPQKMNGVAQHVAHIVLEDTDNVVLTMFSTMSNVSIYSVYHLVIYGVKNMIQPVTGGARALLGELWARQERHELEQTFGWFEWFIHIGIVLLFGCTGILIVPFISVYTQNVTDANYIYPAFAAVFTLANAIHCIRIPYNAMILAAGHYKQTQNCYILAAALNVGISLVAVRPYGLVGIAIGTLISMLFQTLWMSNYVYAKIIQWPYKKFVKQIIVDAITAVIGVLITTWIPMKSMNYFSWVILAVEVTMTWVLVISSANVIFYRDRLQRLLKMLR